MTRLWPRQVAHPAAVLYAARPMVLPLRTAVAMIPAIVLLSGCPPMIGDSCEDALECSINGDRECDSTQPGGYCTLRGCDPNTCPDSAVCVEWRYDLARSSETWCMAQCSADRDCRSDVGYACVAESDPRLLENGTPIARIVDTDEALTNASFCAAFAAP